MQVDTSYAIPQAKVSETSPVSAQQTMHSQSCVTAHNQAREADIQALSLLNRALDEKVIICRFVFSSFNNIFLSSIYILRDICIFILVWDLI